MSDVLGIDLFSGAGGMSLGAIWAGIDVKVAVEADMNAAATFSYNHPDTLMLNEQIENLKEITLKRRNGDRLILFGGPPCQGFSTSNQRTRSAANPTNWLFKEYLRIVRSLTPDWVVFENVTGLVVTDRGRFIEAVVDGFKSLGYSVCNMVLNSQEFGVPQKRARLFIVASLHNERMQDQVKSNETVTVDDAIADLPVLENGALQDKRSYRHGARSGYAERMRGKATECTNHLVSRNGPHIIERFRHVPPGGNWSNIPERYMLNYADRTRCHTGIYRRLDPSRPAVVIGNFRKNMLIHPTQHRGLSVREAARLQSFPDNFVFKGSIGFQQQQVGNAVPPMLARAVFDSIL